MWKQKGERLVAAKTFGVGPRLSSQYFLTHTLWNGRIDEIRPLILLGLGGAFLEAF
jgi:hypothetical protein